MAWAICRSRSSRGAMDRVSHNQHGTNRMGRRGLNLDPLRLQAQFLHADFDVCCMAGLRADEVLYEIDP